MCIQRYSDEFSNDIVFIILYNLYERTVDVMM